MRAARTIRTGAALVSAVTLVGAAVVTLARPSQAGATPTVTAAPATPSASRTVPSASRTVTLVTGERVVVTRQDAGHATAALEPSAGDGRRHRFQTLVTPTAQYVVPDEAMPYLGRQLDLSLFDVAATPTDVTVEWAPSAAPHDIPGLAIRAKAAPAASTGRVSSGRALGAALASGPEALRGVRTIRAASASAASPSVRPQYNLATLVVTGLDRKGAEAGSGSVSVSNADDANRFVSLSSFFEGSVAFSVPEGNYSLAVTVTTPGTDGAAGTESLVVLPEVAVTAPRTVVTADARTATALVPVPATPLPSTARQVSATLARISSSGHQASFTTGYLGDPPVLYVTPVPSVKLGSLHWYTYFRLDGAAADGGTPHQYDLEFPAEGIPDRFPTSVAASSLATLDASYHSDVAQAIDTYRGSFLPWETFSLRPAARATAPLHRTEYVSAHPDVAWVGAVIWRAEEFNGVTQGPHTVYRAGESRPDAYLRSPLVPGGDTGTVQPGPCTACRQGDVLALAVRPWTDGGGHAAELAASTSLEVSTQARLYADGTLVQQSLLPAGQIVVPAASTFRLTLDAAKSAPWTTTGTRTTTTWSWHPASRGGTLPAQRTCPDGTHGCAFEPLLFADYDLGTDLTNALPAGRDATVSVRVHRQAFDTTPAVTTLTLDVSGDDGATWHPVTVQEQDGGVFTATVPAARMSAAGTGFLSVRAHASTSAGDSLDQTITRAARVSAEG